MDLDTIDQTSQTYLGQWKRLVSTTNWDKGRIICEWRTALMDAEVPSGDSSDEAWSRHVGNVTPQHVGRLRRVFERFESVRDTYPGIYWSHFQAALDWDDAEMWLEGAVQSDWSVSQMRKARWEAMGAPSELKPRESDIIVAELDEDAEPMTELRRESLGDTTLATVRDPSDRVEEDSSDDEPEGSYDGQDEDDGTAEPAREPRRPFAELPSLPADVTDAFEAFKLCILRHRLAGWLEISLDDMLGTLDALKELALAPAE